MKAFDLWMRKEAGKGTLASRALKPMAHYLRNIIKGTHEDAADAAVEAGHARTRAEALAAWSARSAANRAERKLPTPYMDEFEAHVKGLPKQVQPTLNIKEDKVVNPSPPTLGF